jgi:hypothetical protein
MDENGKYLLKGTKPKFNRLTDNEIKNKSFNLSIHFLEGVN